MPKPAKASFFLTVGAACLLLAGACGGDSDGGSGGGTSGGTTVELSAQDNEFSPTELSVPAGEEVTVEFTNEGSNTHTFTSEALGVDTGNVAGGGSETVTFTAPDGATDFQCSIHGASGMTGQVVPE